ncbi:hypothetical protein ACIGHG_23510 [Bacillus sp. NPDC077411]|uniref:hypothetical protein n=1 Tax=Bacillus sp. NPDC077411 TaxID=3363947 RepID=UPI0037C79E13
MKNILNAIDFGENIGEITLSNGQILPIPKLSLKKLIMIVKFIGIDGIRMYDNIRETLIDPNLEGFERYVVILESLKEEQLIRIFSITLDISDQEALQLDLNEMLDILIEYADKTNLGKTFTQVRELYKKLFKKELPDFKNLMDKFFPAMPMEDIPLNMPGTNLSKELSQQ